jgi:hypothetical protein
MFRLRSAALALATIALSSCSTLVTAYLVNELLDDKAPKHNWTGTVTDPTGDPVEGVTVSVLAEVEGDDNIVDFNDVTDDEGKYQISFRWNDNVTYALRVKQNDVILLSRNIGGVSNADQQTDLTIQGSAAVAISGLVQDTAGLPVVGALVLAASAETVGGATTLLLGDDAKPLYQITGESGVYQFEGSMARYGVVAAYHPDHGFAYAYDEDDDSNGSLGLTLEMGDNEPHDVRVQVVDNDGFPVASQVLTPDRQFRVRLDTPFNMGADVDAVVDDNDLFTALDSLPSASHPDAATITVQSTGLQGITEEPVEVRGGTYDVKLLRINNSDPATALVISDDPLALASDETVVVRVN